MNEDRRLLQELHAYRDEVVALAIVRLMRARVIKPGVLEIVEACREAELVLRHVATRLAELVTGVRAADPVLAAKVEAMFGREEQRP